MRWAMAPRPMAARRPVRAADLARVGPSGRPLLAMLDVEAAPIRSRAPLPRPTAPVAASAGAGVPAPVRATAASPPAWARVVVRGRVEMARVQATSRTGGLAMARFEPETVAASEV